MEIIENSAVKFIAPTHIVDSIINNIEKNCFEWGALRNIKIIENNIDKNVYMLKILLDLTL